MSTRTPRILLRTTDSYAGQWVENCLHNDAGKQAQRALHFITNYAYLYQTRSCENCPLFTEQPEHTFGNARFYEFAKEADKLTPYACGGSAPRILCDACVRDMVGVDDENNNPKEPKLLSNKRLRQFMKRFRKALLQIMSATRNSQNKLDLMIQSVNSDQSYTYITKRELLELVPREDTDLAREYFEFEYSKHLYSDSLHQQNYQMYI